MLTEEREGSQRWKAMKMEVEKEEGYNSTVSFKDGERCIHEEGCDTTNTQNRIA